MTDEELQESIKLARHRLGPWSLSEEEYAIPKDLCRALVALHAENQAMAAVVEAAERWRHGIVEMTDGALLDTDDGTVAQGLMRKPARRILADAIDAYRARRQKETP